MGFIPGIKAFTAAVLGGIGNIPGAMLGGIFLGLVESVGPSLFLDGLGIVAPYQLKDAIAFIDARPRADLSTDRHSWRASGSEEGINPPLAIMNGGLSI